MIYFTVIHLKKKKFLDLYGPKNKFQNLDSRVKYDLDIFLTGFLTFKKCLGHISPQIHKKNCKMYFTKEIKY